MLVVVAAAAAACWDGVVYVGCCLLITKGECIEVLNGSFGYNLLTNHVSMLFVLIRRHLRQPCCLSLLLLSRWWSCCCCCCGGNVVLFVVVVVVVVDVARRPCRRPIPRFPR
jgi:hypothetical protein